MAQFTVFIRALLFQTLLVGVATSADGECSAEGTCAQLEESMRFELLQETKTVQLHAPNAAPLAATDAPIPVKAFAAAERRKGLGHDQTALATAAAKAPAVAVAPAAVNATAALNTSAALNASGQQLPGGLDIGTIIGGIASAISGDGNPADIIGGVVDSVAGGAVASLLTPIQNAVNNSLAQFNEQVDHLLTRIVMRRAALITSAQVSWTEFTGELNATIGDALDTWQNSVDWEAITGALNTAGGSGLLPDEVTEALEQLTSFATILGNATTLAQGLMQAENMGYAAAAEQLGTLNTTMHTGLRAVFTAKENLKAGFATLTSTISTRLRALPGFSVIPDSVMETVQGVFESSQGTVDTVADAAYSAALELVTGVEEASLIVLGSLPSGAQRAAGFAPLLAAATLAAPLLALA